MRSYFSFILLVSLVILTCCEFHLDKKFSLNISSVLKSIISISEQKIGVVQKQQSSRKSTITVFKDANFSVKAKQVIAIDLASEPKFVGEEVVLNYGKNISFLSNQVKKKTTYKVANLAGNQILTNSQHTLISTQKNCSAILQINLQTKQSTLLQLDKDFMCPFAHDTQLVDMGNGLLLYMNKKQFFFLNSSTYSVTQLLNDTTQFAIISYQSASGASNTSSGQSTVLLDYGLLDKFIIAYRNTQTKQYYVSHKIVIPNYLNVTITGPQQATVTSAQLGEKVYMVSKWQNFNTELYIDLLDRTQILVDQTTLAVSQSQDIFVTYLGKVLYFYKAPNVTDSYKVVLIKNITLSGTFAVKSSTFSQNDQFLLVSTNSTFYKINMSDYNVTSLVIGDCSVQNTRNVDIPGYVLLSCYTSSPKRYWVQLRATDSLQILDTLNITQSTNYGVGIRTGLHWNGYFMVLVKTSILSISNDDAKGWLYKVENQKIVNANVSTVNTISFSRSSVCLQYLVSFKDDVVDANNKSYLTVYNYKDLSVVTKYQHPFASNYFYYLNRAFKNILVVQFQYTGSNYYTHFYDFAQQQSGWYRGSNQRQYYQLGSSQYGYAIFPSLNLYYLYSVANTINTTIYPVKAVYDINKPPIIRQFVLNQTAPFQSLFMNNLKQQDGTFCQVYFFVNKKNPKSLGRLIDCNSQYQQQSFDLQTDIASIASFRLSSSKQHVIMVLKQPSGNYQIDIRNVSDPNSTVYFQNQISTTVKNVDFTPNDLLIVNYGSYATLGSITQKPIESPSDYGLSLIVATDFNEKGNFVFSGQVDGVSKVLYKEQISSSALTTTFGTRGTVTMLSLSSQGSYIAASQGTRVIIWSVTTAALKVIGNYSNYVGVVGVRFQGDQNLIIKFGGTFVIKNVSALQMQTQLYDENGDDGNDGHLRPYSYSYNLLRAKTKQQFQQLKAAFVAQVQISSDNSYIAQTISNTQVKIINSTSMQTIVIFKLPDPTQIISDLTFTPNNTLLVACESGRVYSMSPTPCPQTLMNLDGICVCETNRTFSGDTCVCEHNFVQQQQSKQCRCPTQFMYQNGRCECATNSIQQGSVCVCVNNLTKIQNRCGCAAPFVVRNSLCLCQNNQIPMQNYTKCGCDSEHTLQNNVCVCKQGYELQNKCVACQFPCATCSQSATHCESYQGGFYGIIAGGAVLFIAIVAGVVLVVIKKRKAKQSQLLKDTDDE